MYIIIHAPSEIFLEKTKWRRREEEEELEQEEEDEEDKEEEEEQSISYRGAYTIYNQFYF